MQLTIDADVQQAAEDGFYATGFNGAAVVLDPRNGEVLAFTSHPAYDPNAFAAGIDRATWAELNTDELRPLSNRALQGRYSPGSTFKMAVGLAGLEEGVITPEFRVFCGGGQTFFGRFFKCWQKGGHGSIDLRHAIEQSCDVFFYTVGNMLGVDRINKWATLFGLGVKSGIDLPNEVQGLVPSQAWKAAVHERKEVVPGRNDLRRDRAGAGVRHADFDGGLHGDARQRRHPRYASPGQGRGRWAGVEASPAAATAVAGGRVTRRNSRRFATACGSS